jgi:hypothetical protein
MNVAVGLSGLGQRAQAVEGGAVAMTYVYKYFTWPFVGSSLQSD